MEAQKVEVLEPKVGDLPDEKVPAALPEDSVTKKPEQIEEMQQAAPGICLQVSIQ